MHIYSFHWFSLEVSRCPVCTIHFIFCHKACYLSCFWLLLKLKLLLFCLKQEVVYEIFD